MPPAILSPESRPLALAADRACSSVTRAVADVGSLDAGSSASRVFEKIALPLKVCGWNSATMVIAPAAMAPTITIAPTWRSGQFGRHAVGDDVV
jgi:hypothetical protein